MQGGSRDALGSHPCQVPGLDYADGARLLPTTNPEDPYFEAGFAKGLGRQVIFTCRKDHMDKVHFDTNHYSHITWETPEDLRQKHANRIRATILDGK